MASFFHDKKFGFKFLLKSTICKVFNPNKATRLIKHLRNTTGCVIGEGKFFNVGGTYTFAGTPILVMEGAWPMASFGLLGWVELSLTAADEAKEEFLDVAITALGRDLGNAIIFSGFQRVEAVTNDRSRG